MVKLPIWAAWLSLTCLPVANVDGLLANRTSLRGRVGSLSSLPASTLTHQVDPEAFVTSQFAFGDSDAKQSLFMPQYGSETGLFGTHRVLMSGYNDFETLSCNKPALCHLGRKTWTQMGLDTRVKVVIPCGVCVTMDFQGGRLVLAQGIDIRGQLIFPDGYKISIETPFVLVQGLLTMRSLHAVTGTPDVSFLLTGSTSTRFVPAGNNMYACSAQMSGTPEPCDVGPKAFVVAGGRLDIRGMQDQCSSWTKLRAIVPTPANVAGAATMEAAGAMAETSSPAKAQSLVSTFNDNDCNNFVVHEEFNDASTAWTGGGGSVDRGTGSLNVFDRKSATDDGPSLDLNSLQRCLVPDELYLFSFRVRLHKNRMAFLPTDCAFTGSSCLTVRLQATLSNGTDATRLLTGERPDHKFIYEEWNEIYGTVRFSLEELSPDAGSHIMQLSGPEPGVDIEVDDFRFMWHDDESSCDQNLVVVGGGNNSSHPYPMWSIASRLSVVTDWDGRSFYRLSKRSAPASALVYELPHLECVAGGGTFLIDVDLRLLSEVSETWQIIYEVDYENSGTVEGVVSECDAQGRDWTRCHGEVMIPAEAMDSGTVKGVRFIIRTKFSSWAFDVSSWSVQRMSSSDRTLSVTSEGTERSIVVSSSGVLGCWAKGSEVLITSSTIDMNSAQVLRLVADPMALVDGTVRLDLNGPVLPSVTEVDRDGFAVEVALLSRNIVLRGGTDEPDPLLGGHLIIYHTPAVAQRLNGVEIVNFGRQGELGRYPIHFHMCGAVEGAVIEKNTVRSSNQRCVVVHGTHNATVADNVAYETKGHCYITEDGGELYNRFLRNLGANTRAAQRLTRPGETDGIMPSTFWASNPMNEWVGNVAAGSQSSGFWFELNEAVRPPTLYMPGSAGMVPKHLPLLRFYGNSAHSNWEHGLRTYPQGFMPPETANFDSLKSYKNRQGGIFFHMTRNVLVKSGILADNLIQLDLDRAEQVEVDGTVFVGQTFRYGQLLLLRPNVLARDKAITGIELHSFQFEQGKGATIRNANFVRFDKAGIGASLIRVDGADVQTGQFGFWTTVQNVKRSGDVAPFDFDLAAAFSGGVSNAYVVDIDSSMRPTGVSASGVSTVMTNSDEMKSFVDQSLCTASSASRTLYCRNTCLRTIIFAINDEGTGNVQLRLTSKSNGKSFSYAGKMYSQLSDDGSFDKVANSDILRHRYYYASLPAGQYVASFTNASDATTWPTFVEQEMSPELCSGGVDSRSVQLAKPNVSMMTCANLIKNGNMEASSSGYPNWGHYMAGIAIAGGKGVNGSNALVDTYFDDARGALGQFVDTRCLVEGVQYELRAWVLLLKNGSGFTCTANCPRIRLRIKSSAGLSFRTVTNTFAAPVKNNEFNLLQGVITIDSKLAQAQSVAFWIERGSAGVQMLVDNAAMSKVEDGCRNLVFNGALDSGDTSFWSVDDPATSLAVVNIGGNSVLKHSERSTSQASIIQHIQTGCMVERGRYAVQVRVKLVSPDGTTFNCNPTTRSGSQACPSMNIRSFLDYGLSTQTYQSHPSNLIAVADHGRTSDGFFTVSGVFSATNYDQRADKSILYVTGAPAGKDVLVDDVSIASLPNTCQQLFLNGDAEGHPTSSYFWKTWVLNGGAKISLVSNGSNNRAFKVTNRSIAGDGIVQETDPRCFTAGSRWKLKAQMKLISRSSGFAVSCIPGDTRFNYSCPPVRISGYDASNAKVEDKRYEMSNQVVWKPAAFNTYEATIVVSNTLASCSRVEVAIREYVLDWDIVVDNISLSPV